MSQRTGRHYYISFKDGQGALHEFEISKTLYDAFNDFELRDISYLHNCIPAHM